MEQIIKFKNKIHIIKLIEKHLYFINQYLYYKIQ